MYVEKSTEMQDLKLCCLLIMGLEQKRVWTTSCLIFKRVLKSLQIQMKGLF